MRIAPSCNPMRLVSNESRIVMRCDTCNYSFDGTPAEYAKIGCPLRAADNARIVQHFDPDDDGRDVPEGGAAFVALCIAATVGIPGVVLALMQWGWI